MAINFSSSFNFLGTGIEDLFGASGSRQDAASLDKAAGMVGTEIQYTEASNALKLAASKREVGRALGGQQSDIAGAGFKLSGTALDLARDSAQQGYLTTALIGTQGNIDVQDLSVKKSNLEAEAASARSQANASGIGGLLNIGLGVLGLFGL